MLEVEENIMDISPDKENGMESSETDINIMEESSEKDNTQPKELYAFRPFVFTEIRKSSKSQEPSPRSGHRIVCDERNLYSLGGYLEINSDDDYQGSNYIRSRPAIRKKVVFRELYKFNFCHQQWKPVATKGKFPSGQVSHTIAFHGNHLVVYGGTSLPFGDISSNSVDICNLATKTWTQLSTYGQNPGGLYGHSMILDELKKCLYIIGGTTGYEFFIDIYKLDLVSGQWEALFVSQGNILETGEPSPRYRLETAFDGTLIYIIGGGKQACCDSFTSIPVFNIVTRAWSKKDTVGDDVHLFPASRKCHGLIQTNENIWMTGGENKNELFDEFWNLHLPTMKWSMIFTRIPLHLSFHSVCITPPGCMYIFGGVHKIHQGGQGTVFKDRTNTLFKIWLKIPSLKEICWEALLFYDSSMKLLPQDQLIAKGIPREFADRVQD